MTSDENRRVSRSNKPVAATLLEEHVANLEVPGLPAIIRVPSFAEKGTTIEKFGPLTG